MRPLWIADVPSSDWICKLEHFNECSARYSATIDKNWPWDFSNENIQSELHLLFCIVERGVLIQGFEQIRNANTFVIHISKVNYKTLNMARWDEHIVCLKCQVLIRKLFVSDMLELDDVGLVWNPLLLYRILIYKKKHIKRLGLTDWVIFHGWLGFRHITTSIWPAEYNHTTLWFIP